MTVLKNVSGWLVTLLVPIVLVLFGIGILLSPIYIQIEYRMPYFPEDSYGFTRMERLYWADLSIEYLINWEGIDFFSGIAIPRRSAGCWFV
ncbi:hypothetical protein ACFLXI_07955 [Chloroflexota bacterium]